MRIALFALLVSALAGCADDGNASDGPECVAQYLAKQGEIACLVRTTDGPQCECTGATLTDTDTVRSVCHAAVSCQ